MLRIDPIRAECLRHHISDMIITTAASKCSYAAKLYDSAGGISGVSTSNNLRILSAIFFRTRGEGVDLENEINDRHTYNKNLGHGANKAGLI